MLNCVLRCWGIAPQPDDRPANPTQVERPSTRRSSICVKVDYPVNANPTPAVLIQIEPPSTRRSSVHCGEGDSSTSRESTSATPVRGSIDCGVVLPPEFRKRSSSTTPKRIGSAAQQPATFIRMRGLDYSSLRAVRGNPWAKADLAQVMKEQYCLENLNFLDDLDALHATEGLNAKWQKFNDLVAKWIGAQAASEINIGHATRDGLIAALAASQQAAEIGSGSEVDKLLCQAATHVEGLIERGAALQVLNARLIDTLPRASAHRQSLPLLTLPKLPFKRTSLPGPTIT